MGDPRAEASLQTCDATAGRCFLVLPLLSRQILPISFVATCASQPGSNGHLAFATKAFHPCPGASLSVPGVSDMVSMRRTLKASGSSIFRIRR